MRTRSPRFAWVPWLCAGLFSAACAAKTPERDSRPSPSAGSAGFPAAGSGESGSLAMGNAGFAALAGASAIGGQAGRLGGAAGMQTGVAGATAPRAGAPAAAGGGAAGQQPPPGPPGTWPAADPAKMGPFATVTENSVGPGMAYTMFRPKDLTQRHPVITWGNGTGTMPTTYRGLLTLYASHGFIVIASNSQNVAQGTPPPMLDGVTWVLEQDMTQGVPLYQHVDRDRIGATGHSQGALAASSAGTDPRIKSIAPIETLSTSRGLHGPVLGLCGSMDTTVPCSGNLRSFMAISDQPVMYAEQIAADHTNWIYTPGGGFNPYWVITTAWFRVQLMNDTALRPMFYGDCSICKDTATWITMRKMMDQ
jgi:Chlorophyllase enzyme